MHEKPQSDKVLLENNPKL